LTFETVLQQYQQKHSFPEYISFITFLISQYFNQKIEHSKDQFDIISKEISLINQKIVELKNQNEFDPETQKFFVNLRFDLIYQMNDKPEIQKEFFDLYDIFLEKMFSPFNENEIKETLYLLIQFGMKFDFEGVSYEIFSSIVFLSSLIPPINEECENIWKMLVTFLNPNDKINLKNQMQTQLTKEPSLKSILQTRTDYL
jgi:hypothetical protein